MRVVTSLYVCYDVVDVRHGECPFVILGVIGESSTTVVCTLQAVIDLIYGAI